MKTSVTALRKRLSRPYEQIVIEGVTPAPEHTRFPAKAIVGETCAVEATVFRHGDERIRVAVRVRRPGTAAVKELPMLPVVDSQDRWHAEFLLDAPGRFTLTLAAWTDQFASWVDRLRQRVATETDAAGEVAEGLALVERAAAGVKGDAKKEIAAVLQRLKDAGDPQKVLAIASEPASVDLIGRVALRDDEVRSEADIEVMADRPLASAGAWFEPVVKGLGASPTGAGGVTAVECEFARIHGLGFDVVRLAPGDPSGATTSTEAETAERLIHAANVLGLEVAVNLPTRCAPGHPWVGEHPDWFQRHPESSGGHALNFETADWKRLWHELREVVRRWIGHGVKIFSVDEPHHRPIGFWSWLIEEIHLESPEVIFLAGACSRVSIARTLGVRGFTQSLVTLPADVTKIGLTSWFAQLTSPAMATAIRPNVLVRAAGCVNTALKMRLVLASTLFPSYIVVDPPSDLDDWITRLNAVRKATPALQRADNLRFVDTGSEHLLAYVKATPDRSSAVIVVVNLDADQAHEGRVRVPEDLVGLSKGERFVVDDALSGETFAWAQTNLVSLDPKAGAPAQILVVRGR